MTTETKKEPKTTMARMLNCFSIVHPEDVDLSIQAIFAEKTIAGTATIIRSFFPLTDFFPELPAIDFDNYVNWEMNEAAPVMEELGYQKIHFSNAETDGFGVLSRKVSFYCPVTQCLFTCFYG